MFTGLSLFLAFLLVLLNGFFVAAEFALVKVRSTRIAQLAEEGQGTARMALHEIHHLDAYLSATQLGITLASIALGWIGEPAVASLLEPLFQRFNVPPAAAHGIAFFVAFSVISAFHIVIGELAPKSWAIQQAERVSLAVAYPLHWFYWLFRVPISALNGLAAALLRRFGIAPAQEHELAHSQEELQMIVSASGESGTLKDSEVDLVKHVFEFADKNARDVMVPRVDVAFMDTAWSAEHALEVARSHTYTRYPLIEGDPDHVVGLVSIKDFVLLGEAKGDMRQLRREILRVPETKPIDQLLREFQATKIHMAVVLDEFGGTAGIVTLEDVLEEIVGEIHDENELPVTIVEALGPDEFLVDARAPLADLRADYGIHLPDNGSDSLAGWVLDQLGAIPEPGERVAVDGCELTVEEVTGQRIRKVRITRCGSGGVAASFVALATSAAPAWGPLLEPASTALLSL